MIDLTNISIQYGGQVLFNGLNLSIRKKDRIGLVGKNGAGKTTLMKVMMREIIADEGQVVMSNHTSLGYLKQEVSFKDALTVFEETNTAFDQILEIEKQIAELTEQISNHSDYTSADYAQTLENLEEATDRLQRLGGSNKDEAISRVLTGLGFLASDFNRPLSEFSGGWRMRVELAKILLRQPDFILLDEPTNHLDIESIIWLEGFLRNYHGGVVLISHDKEFLDKVGNRTVELVAGKIYDYRNSYSEFVELRKSRVERQIIEAKRQSKEVEETTKLINKFRAKKNKAKFAQTLIRKLDKMETVEIDDMERAKIRFRFPPAPRSGKEVVSAESLYKAYGDLKVLNDISFSLMKGEKVAFVGKNGEGKTTLSKIIGGRTDFQGKCSLGHNVEVGYFEQNQAENLDGNVTVFDFIDNAATGELRQRVRSLLGAFLFSGEDVDKKIMVLSGGEKSRLAVARLLLQPVNLLILDEPTNHLDMAAKEVLKQALLDFEGSMIVVSHDRDFLKGLTDKVYEFKNKKIHEHIGDLQSFLEKREIANLNELERGRRTETKKASQSAEQQKRNKNQEWELDKAIKRVKNKVSKSEKLISQLEKEIAEMEAAIGKADFYQTEKAPDLFLRHYEERKSSLNSEMENWETLSIEIEDLEAQKNDLSR